MAAGGVCLPELITVVTALSPSMNGLACFVTLEFTAPNARASWMVELMPRVGVLPAMGATRTPIASSLALGIKRGTSPMICQLVPAGRFVGSPLVNSLTEFPAASTKASQLLDWSSGFGGAGGGGGGGESLNRPSFLRRSNNKL